MPDRHPGRVVIEENIVVGEGGGRPLQGDVYLPPEDGVDRTAILLLHGGGWEHGDRTQLRGYGLLLAQYGFVCVCAEYRLSGESVWPAQIDDVTTALRWLRANADRYDVDESRICVSGNSAGGHLALMLGGVTDGEVAAVVAIYPPTQLRVESGTGPDQMVRRLLGGDVSRQVEDAASPITYARADFPPTMLVHGNADDVVPVGASFAMYHALIAAGAQAELHVFDGAPHGFDATPRLGHPLAELIALFFDRKVRSV